MHVQGGQKCFSFLGRILKLIFLQTQHTQKNAAMMCTWLIFVCVHIRVFSFHLASDWLNNHKIHSLDLLSENRASLLLSLIKHTFLYWTSPNELFRFPYRTSGWVISEIHVHTQNKLALWCVFECGISTWRNCDSPHRLSTAFWQIDDSGAWIPPCSQTAQSIKETYKTTIMIFFPPQKNLEQHDMGKCFPINVIFTHTPELI